MILRYMMFLNGINLVIQCMFINENEYKVICILQIFNLKYKDEKKLLKFNVFDLISLCMNLVYVLRKNKIEIMYF